MTKKVIDKLNNLESSTYYEKYFDEMKISDKEKENRKKLARSMETMFLMLFAMIVQEDESFQNCYKYVSDKYCQIATEYMNAKTASAYISKYVAQITKSIIDTTIENKDSEYYLSKDRAIVISANEANSIANYSEQVEMVKKGYRHKIWQTIKDNHVRHTHIELDEKKIGIFESFEVGGTQMMFPKDTSLGADAFPEETVNCRCSLSYTKD